MALAVIHHAVARQRLSISRIIEMLAALSRRWLLLEFAPPLMPSVGISRIDALDDFNADDVDHCLRKYFKTISVLPSFPKERSLFVCEK